MRADAQKSRRLLLDAACALLIEVGPDVSLEAIARRAGVGIANSVSPLPPALGSRDGSRCGCDGTHVRGSHRRGLLRSLTPSPHFGVTCIGPWMSAPRPSCRCSTTNFERARGEGAAGCDRCRGERTDRGRPATGFASSRCRLRRHRAGTGQVLAPDRAWVRTTVRSGRGAPTSGCLHRWSARSWRTSTLSLGPDAGCTARHAGPHAPRMASSTRAQLDRVGGWGSNPRPRDYEFQTALSTWSRLTPV